MNEIKIFDNFLNETDFNRVMSFTQYAIWQIQGSVNKGNREFLYINVSDEEFFNSHIFHKIEKKLNCKYKLERIYFNGQWPGRDGEFHEDTCKHTAMIYVNPYDPDWGGFTQFLISPTEQYIVPPVQNRLIVFPGHLTHKGYSYSKQNCPMRISLAFKLL